MLENIDLVRLRPSASIIRPCDYLPAGALAVNALEEPSCRWPLGEVWEDGFRFCGARRHKGSYCLAHGLLARKRSRG